MIVSTVRPQNDNILIVSDKFWGKIVCDILNISNICLKCDLGIAAPVKHRKSALIAFVK